MDRALTDAQTQPESAPSLNPPPPPRPAFKNNPHLPAPPPRCSIGTVIFSKLRFFGDVCSFSVMMHGGTTVVQAAVRKHLIKKSASQPEKKAPEGGEEERRPGRMNAA
ncbi:hypothetical protein BDFB_001210 [Asbolus verrucosus]|uniref:Uncharacterized protein n=1 Tax=Asbolus verrucosus TaxID=1661398 RepID=A0A482VN21_ASBVE|nr:hypothetical protein BDFB_001210 [Asbolus verrucosus]